MCSLLREGDFWRHAKHSGCIQESQQAEHGKHGRHANTPAVWGSQGSQGAQALTVGGLGFGMVDRALSRARLGAVCLDLRVPTHCLAA